ncbi:MAG TPA: DUF6282 family protein [Streptosporangiaceae bacterium]|nr:DUF6282 family protein [Streptosporangiaceae bacterium]
MTNIQHEGDGAGSGRDLAAQQNALPSGSAALLRKAFDVHVHGQPDVVPDLQLRGSDLDTMRLAHAYGLSGWVLKSHLWLTTDRARLLQELADGLDFIVYGSITLNPVMGGLSATVVELAAAHGARVVFLPTWGSAADVARDGYIARLLAAAAPSFRGYNAANAVSLLGADGRLSGPATEVIDACRDLGLSLATGHVSLTESRAVTEYCAQTGQRVLVTHPLHYTTSAAELRVFAEAGAYVEFCNGPLLHPDGHLGIRDIHEAITALGIDRVVLSTDAFSRWAPPQPECLRMFAEQLAYLGWQPAELHQMLAVNPRAFLGIAPAVASTEPEEQ